MQYDNYFLFSETYIGGFIKNIGSSDNTEADNLFDSILSWYQEYKTAWEIYEDIVLDSLGFSKTMDGAFRILSTGVGNPVAVAYLLPEDADLNSTAKGKYYAVDAIKAAKKNDVAWAIVTNGMKWRLYHTKEVSPYEFYFAVDLTEDFVAEKPSDNTRIFCKLFSNRAFLEMDGVLPIDAWKEASATAEETVEEMLREKAEDILKELCYGLKENMGQSIFTDDDRKMIYNDAIVLLYRMLFLGYAESRNLLPVVFNDPDYNDSFSELCETAKDYYLESKLLGNGNDFDLWERLDTQLRIYVDKNYNGGLFSNEDKPILRTYRIANKHLAVCLLELSYIAGRKKEYKDKIEYRDLSVRNLGAIYEGLLEYQLFIAEETMVQRKSKDKVAYFRASEIQLTNADRNNLFRPGEIYLSQDALERKETGAYYTPEDVVEYIVDNTIGKKLQELKAELEESTKELRQELSYEPVEQNRITIRDEIDKKTVAFINEKILGLSVIDSAMGSGHFLVNATYKIANFIVELLQDDSWENDELDVSVTTWKRKVVENCMYGIDINNLSVLLARLSLWFISMSNDKALSFLDHHLKCGNSLMGATIEQLQYFDENFPILSVTKERFIYPVIKKYEMIREIGSDTKADVCKQHEIYKEIIDDLAVVKKKMDYYLACQYCEQVLDGMDFRDVLLADDSRFFEKDEHRFLLETADGNRFFHWEVEFPEIYISGGFDIMIGNPPYGANLSEKTKTFFKTIYETVHMRTPDSFNYFIAKSFDLLNEEGEVSFIVPNNLLFQNEYEKTRRFLVSKHSIKRVVNAGDNVFERASVSTCVFVAKNKGEDFYEILYSDMRSGYRTSREWNAKIIKINADSVLATPSCVVGVSEESASILDKIKKKSSTINELAEEVAAGISTGGNEAFCVNGEDIRNESLERLKKEYRFRVR